LLSRYTTESIFQVTWATGCETPPTEAVAALAYAADLWSTFIASPVSITVSACWTSSPPCGGLACGDTTQYVRNFDRAPMVDTYYPVALAQALTGVDLMPSGFDIAIHFQAGADWSYGTVTPAPSGVDFVSVAMHELGHGLGFTGHMYEDYNVGFCGDGPYGFLYPCPTAYDRLVVDSQGVPLLSYMGTDQFTLATRLKSDANQGGPNATARHGARVKLYTPAVWDHGSSLSHLDPGTFSGGENTLMLPTYQNGTRHPGPVTLAILQDIGWRRADGAPNLIPSGPMAVGAGQAVTFTSALDWAGYNDQTITYTWQARGGTVLTRTAQTLSEAVTLSWPAPGLGSFTATATVSDITASAIRLLLVFDVAVNGPAQGDTLMPYTFNATVAGASGALPVSYHWTATDLASASHPDLGTSDAMTFTWTTPGTKTVTVTATIDGETAQAAHTIQIGGVALDHFVFLPLVQRP
jgi:hypothetical protein